MDYEARTKVYMCDRPDYGLWFTMLFQGLCVNVGFMVYDASCSKVYMFAVLGLVG